MSNVVKNTDSKQFPIAAVARSGGSIHIPPRSASAASDDPDPEVCAERPRRRKFSAAFKMRILGAVDACSEPGEVGRILRREGLYSSHLKTWRDQRDAGAKAGLVPKKRGRKPVGVEAQSKEIDRLKRENEMLRNQLHKAELIIDIQKKTSQLLGIPLHDMLKDGYNS